MLQLKLLSSVSLMRDGAPLAGPAAQRRRLALLAVLAAAPESGVSRDKLVGYFWPDTESDQARRFLADSVYALRRALGQDAILSAGDNLALNAAAIAIDVVEFRALLAEGNWEAAVRLYEGPFLDGFYVPGAAEFELWAEGERAQMARQYGDALERLAQTAAARGEHGRAADWWRRAQHADPLNSRVALQLASALDASGDRAAALRHVQTHEVLLRNELGIAPDAAVTAFAERLRSATPVPLIGTSQTAPPRAGLPPTEPLATVTVPPASADTTTPAAAPARLSRIRLWAVALVLVAVGAAAVARWLPRTGNARVIVMTFENRTGDPALDAVGRMAADWIARGLLGTGILEVVSPTWTNDSSSTIEGPRAGSIISRTAAGTLVTGAYYRDGARLRFEAQVLDSRGRLLHSLDPVVVPVDSGIAGVELLRQRVAGGLAARFVAQELREITARAQPPTYAAYAEYIEGARQFARFQPEQAAIHFERAWTLDTTFHLARLLNVLALFNAGQRARGGDMVQSLVPQRDQMAPFDRVLLEVFEADLAGDQARLLRSLRSVAAMTPGSQFVVGYAVAAIASNRPREALATLRRVDPNVGLFRENPRYWEWLTVARHLLGEHGQELQEARRGRTLHGDMRVALAQEIRSLAALGRVDDVEQLLQQNLSLWSQSPETAADALRAAGAELRAHGHAASAMRALEQALAWYRDRPVEERQRFERVFARTLYDAERWEEARAMFVRLAAEQPDNISHLGYLGALAARRGEHSEAGRMAALLAATKQSDPRGAHTLWRARIAALLGERERALQLLRDAFSQGAAHGMWLHTDPDFAALRDDRAFVELLRPEG